MSADTLIDSTLYLKFGLPMSLDDLTPLFHLTPIDHPLNPNVTSMYSSEFGFERLFESRSNVNSIKGWFQSHWRMSFVVAALYCALVYAGRVYMRTRDKYELRSALIVWNVCLAAFSIAGTMRTWPEFLYAIFDRGLVYSVCDVSFAYSITGFWAFSFVVSKLPELIDTLFIVLRKQELIFLHWYHHATVLVYCWFSYSEFIATGRWFMCMNYLVHALMYSYYALKAARIRVPLFVSKLITLLQISQMFVGCFVNWLAYTTKRDATASCHVTDDNIFYSFVMYTSYFLLFFQFFLDAYIKANAKHKLKVKQQQQAATAAVNGETKQMNGQHSNGKKID